MESLKVNAPSHSALKKLPLRLCKDTMVNVSLELKTLWILVMPNFLQVEAVVVEVASEVTVEAEAWTGAAQVATTVVATVQEDTAAVVANEEVMAVEIGIEDTVIEIAEEIVVVMAIDVVVDSVKLLILMKNNLFDFFRPWRRTRRFRR